MTTKPKISPKLRAVLTAMVEGETLWQKSDGVGVIGPVFLGSASVNKNITHGARDRGLIERNPDSPKGAQFYRLTDAGREALS